MVAFSTWLRYMTSKFDYSVSAARTSYIRGQIADKEILDTIWKNFLHGRLTFLHWNKGEEMDPMIGTQGGTLLVRKIPAPNPTRVRVGDVVVLKDPEDSANYLVRRLAAIEGYEMGSKDVNDESFVLEKDQCWVLADNNKLKPKCKIAHMLVRHLIEDFLRQLRTKTTEAYDSRTFGPVTMANIVGRALYCLKNAVDHGPVKNSHFSTVLDSPVLEVELDVDDMVKNHKA